MLFFQILLVSMVIASACSLVGVFLVLKRMALLSDAIGHSILLGIVVFALVTQSLTSPLLLLGAGLSGVFLVFCIELLSKAKLIKQSIAMGIMYPLFFSIAIILINVFAKNVHLDTHVVVMGEIAFTVFDQLKWNGHPLGPEALYVGLVLLLMNAGFITVCYKPLKLTSFDPTFAVTLGISPVIFHYMLIGLTSFTVVGSFRSTGAILVIAFIVGPPATAFLLTKRLNHMIFLSVLIAWLSCGAGTLIAFAVGSSIAGCIAASMGLGFVFVGLLAPTNGMVWKLKRRRTQRVEVLQLTLLMHLSHHQATPHERHENTRCNLIEHFRWSAVLAQKIIQLSEKKALITSQDERLYLTQKGQEHLLSQVSSSLCMDAV